MEAFASAGFQQQGLTLQLSRDASKALNVRPVSIVVFMIDLLA